MTQEWKVGDWAVFERDIVQIKEFYGEGGCAVSEGMFTTSGRLLDRLRQLTLRNKRIIEYFDYYYKELDKIDGNRGFNFPDISRYFANLALLAIDGPDDDKNPYDAALEFVKQAKEHKSQIQGVALFRAA